MCEPTTATLMYLAIASSVASAGAQYMQASAQEDALEASAQAQAEETGARVQQQVSERVAEARRERARLRVAAGEAGIQADSGSFQAQMRNSFAKQNRDIGIIKANKNFAQRGIQTAAGSQAANIRSGLQIATELGGNVVGAMATRQAADSGR